MARDLKHNLTLKFGGNISQTTSRWANSVKRFSSKTTRNFAKVSRSVAVMSKGIDKLGNKYTGMLTGLGATAAIRSVSALEKRITRIAVQAGKSKKEVKSLVEDIYSTAQNRNINIAPSELFSAVEKIVEKTGDLKLAEKNLENLGLVISATGAAGADAGSMIADFTEKFGIKNASEMLKVLDATANQGKAGAFTLEHLATQGERVTAAYGQLGRVGPEAVREMVAMLQMIKRSVGGPEQAATAMEAYTRSLNDARKRKLIGKLGVSLVDPEDPNRLRSMLDITKDIVRQSKGNQVLLRKIFDSEALRALTAVNLEYKKTGGFASLDNFMNVSSDGKTLRQDSGTIAATFDSVAESVKTAGSKAMKDSIEGSMKDAAGLVNSTSSSTLEKGFKGAGALAATGAGIWGANKFGRASIGAAKLAKSGYKWLWGGKNAANAAKTTGAVSRYGATASKAAKIGKYAKAGKFIGTAGKIGGKVLSKAATPLIVASSAYDIYGAAKTGDKKEIGGAIGGAAGTFGGLAAGAAIGTGILPGVGTAIGAIAGALIGEFGGKKIGKKVAEEIYDDKRSAVKGEITINFKNTPPGTQVTTQEFSGNSNINIKMGMTEAFND